MPSQGSAMFITVRHGADEQDLFNPDCALRLLVDNIRKRCNFPQNATVALADENLSIVHLQEDSMENASSTFTDRGVYILLAVKQRENGPPKYVSMLDDIIPELTAHLERLSNPRASETKLGSLKGNLAKGKKSSRTSLTQAAGSKTRKQLVGTKSRSKV